MIYYIAVVVQEIVFCSSVKLDKSPILSTNSIIGTTFLSSICFCSSLPPYLLLNYGQGHRRYYRMIVTTCRKYDLLHL